MVIKIFIDTDVIISSLISQSGAAHLLLNQTKNLKLYVSNISIYEIDEVTRRLNLDIKKQKNLIINNFSQVIIKEEIKELKTFFADYVLDSNDAHIVAGAKKSHSQFLISYNTKHFRINKLKENFNIILATPANLLQYLRSIK
ncbi:PIN domain-containing protein [Patescibacteria group bacterium]|nr:PIN domain-containing protein [Patescibacteria group bacterium]MBU4017365.1 PIN domain-containing protein [Patescibacteria group bacterium]MBU4099536.1 PIN domain-containing protein [Patescibacteria group bacterium]